MKLHLPLGLLAALLAATPIAQAETGSSRIYHKERVDITSCWEQLPGTSWMHLNFAEVGEELGLPGLSRGLSSDVAWVVHFNVTDKESAVNFGSVPYTTSDRNDFSVSIDPNYGINESIEYSGYGWSFNGGTGFYQRGDIYQNGYDLVWNPDGSLNDERYGDFRGKVGFFWTGTASGGNRAMFDETAGAFSIGPDLEWDPWQGLTDLYATGGEGTGWLQVIISYAYTTLPVNEYVVGGAGNLLADTNGERENGGAGLYLLYSTDPDDPDRGETVVSEQYGYDSEEATIAELYGHQENRRTWNKLRFVAEGTRRIFDAPPPDKEPDPKDYVNGEEDWAYKLDKEKYDDDWKEYEKATEGNDTVGPAGEVRADFSMDLGGIVVRENTGDYTLIAPGFTFNAPVWRTDEDGNLKEACYTIDIAEGGSGTFILKAIPAEDGTTTEAFIDWGDGDATSHMHMLSVATGRTLVLDGAGKGSAGMSIRGGGTVRITDETTLGYGEEIHVTDDSKFDLDGNNLAELPTRQSRTIVLDGGNLRNAENLTTALVDVRSGVNDLGNLDGQYLRSVKQDGIPITSDDPNEISEMERDLTTTRVSGIQEGTTVTLKDGQFSFLIDVSNITRPTKQGPVTPGGLYMLSFSGSGGNLEFDDERGKVDFYLTNDAVEIIQRGEYNGYIDLWFSNGSFVGLEGMDETELDKWFENHFQFRDTKAELIQLDGVFDIVSGNTSARNGGILRLLVNMGKDGGGIWLASLYGDARVDQLSDTSRWSGVRVDENMKIRFTGGENAPTELTLKNLSSGTSGGGTLTIADERDPKAGELKVIIDQQDSTVASWGLRGDLKVQDENITLEKQGPEDLHITGNLQSAGKVTVSNGHLIVDGGGSKVTVSNGRLTVDGVTSSVNTLGNFRESAELVVNGVLDIEGSSSPEGEGTGTISGTGTLRVRGDLTLNENKLKGVAVWLDKKEGSDSYGSLSLSKGSTVSRLIGGEQGVGGTLGLTGCELTIDNSSGDFPWVADFSGSISGQNASIIINGEKVEQILRSEGSEGIGLDVRKGRLTLIGKAKVIDDAQETGGAREQVAAYGKVSIKEGGTLTVQAQGYGKDYAAFTQLKAGQVSVSEGGRLEVFYNLATSDGDLQGIRNSGAGPAISANAGVDWDPNATLALGTVSVNPFDLDKPTDLDNFVILSAGGKDFTGLNDGDKIKVQLGGSFLIYWTNVEVTYKEDLGIVMSGKALDKGVNPIRIIAGNSSNSLAGADMLWEARKSEPMSTANSDLLRVATWVADQSQNPGSAEKTSKALAAVAGSTAPILGTAQREALRSQMLRMRDRTGMMGLNDDYAYESMPFTHFWLEATGDFTNAQDGSDYESGFTYNAWGGTVGLEMDVDETVSVAAGITALYGDLDGGCADTVDGNLDSYYLTLMGRFTKKRWGHTLVGVMGLNQAKLNRTVNFGTDSYRTSGSTSGWVAGFMYEITRDIPLSRESTSVIQPLLGLSVMKTSMSGYDESGANGQGVGLNVGDQDWMTTTLTVGARYIATVGEETFNRPAQMELRANVAQDFGDSQGEVEAALQANPSLSRTMRAAEIGKTALQLGASLRVPISDQTLLYFNAGSGIRSGLTAWNLSVGARYNF